MKLSAIISAFLLLFLSSTQSEGTKYLVGNPIQATINSAPYLVSIQSTAHLCSGVIVGRRWVLTSAQCVASQSSKLLRIRFNTSTHNADGKWTEVDFIVPHNRFNRETLENDIALVKTRDEMNVAVQIVLPNQNDYFVLGGLLTVSGWGFQGEETGTLSADLKQIELNNQNNRCAAAYGAKNITITASMLCAGNLKNGGDSICHGDAGSAAVETESRYKIQGIASFSLGCGRPKFASVFTRVSYFRNWIRDVSGI